LLKYQPDNKGIFINIINIHPKIACALFLKDTTYGFISGLPFEILQIDPDKSKKGPIK
jgi:hypothetical protein